MENIIGSSGASGSGSGSGGTAGSITITLPGCVNIQTDQTDNSDTSNGTTGAGAILAFAGTKVPAGWLLCNGAAISREEYAKLFAAIGTTYGVGNGNTTFSLPDLRGRFPLGLDNMGGTSADRVTAAAADALAGSGGAEKHTLTTEEMPAHRHEEHEDSNVTGIAQTIYNGGTHIHGGSAVKIDAGKPTGSTGGGQAHNNLPPYLTLNYIIMTGN